MILIDPKRVELNHYDGVPHLLTRVVTDPKRATEALAGRSKEMEQRYEASRCTATATSTATTRPSARHRPRRPALSSPCEVPRRASRAPTRQRPRWERCRTSLFVIDELADLMMVAPRDVGVRHRAHRADGARRRHPPHRGHAAALGRRRHGAHQGQHPVTHRAGDGHQADSRDDPGPDGAEKLVGHGDMLFMPANASKPHRIQGCYIDEAEIEKIIEHCTGAAPRRLHRRHRHGGRGRGHGRHARRRRRRRRPRPRRDGARGPRRASAPRRCCSASSRSVSPAPGA